MIMGTTYNSGQPGEKDGLLLERVVRYVHDHAEKSLKVNEVAKAFGMSRRWLCILFATRLGRSPHEEIVRARFARVERFLIESDLTLADIATRCGFRHGEYMSVAFTRRYGIPPSQWRRRRRQTLSSVGHARIG
ncbi:MAG: AraC family transcriptional regulator [Planctomycetia bacterium]